MPLQNVLGVFDRLLIKGFVFLKTLDPGLCGELRRWRERHGFRGGWIRGSGSAGWWSMPCVLHFPWRPRCGSCQKRIKGRFCARILSSKNSNGWGMGRQGRHHAPGSEYTWTLSPLDEYHQQVTAHSGCSMAAGVQPSVLRRGVPGADRTGTATFTFAGRAGARRPFSRRISLFAGRTLPAGLGGHFARFAVGSAPRSAVAARLAAVSERRLVVRRFSGDRGAGWGTAIPLMTARERRATKAGRRSTDGLTQA